MSARVSHSLLDPYLTTPIRPWYRWLRLPPRMPPEAIVLTGHAAAIAAAACWGFAGTHPALAFIAAALIVMHHLCDVFDGQHARATGQCRHGGELLDHFCDPLSIAYLILGWAAIAGNVAWAIPGVVIVMATAVLTNIKAKLGGDFELPRFGPTELKTFLAILAGLTGWGMTWDADQTRSVLAAILLGVSLIAALRLPFELAAAIRSVNRSTAPVDQSEWQNR